MSSSFRIAALTLTLTAGIVVAGCGANTSLSPTGPTTATGTSSGALASTADAEATSAATTFSDAGAFDTQKKKKDEHPGEDGEHEHGRPDGKRVEVNGHITALDAGARKFSVGTQQVSVPLTAIIRHGSKTLLFTDLQLGDHVEVKGSMGATALDATEVKVEQGGKGDDGEDGDGDRDEPELNGAVAALVGTCPALTFNVGTTKVTTSATTTFRGITCAAVALGTIVEVDGTKQGDGSIVATRVSFDAELSGAVSALAGTCPALTFNILTTKVTTSATTTFRGTTCATVADGAVVEVQGTKQADGSIAATRVSRDD